MISFESSILFDQLNSVRVLNSDQFILFQKFLVLIVTLKYFVSEFSDDSRTIVIRCLINTSGEISVFDLKSSFESIIQNHIGHIFSRDVRFTHLQLKVTGSEVKTALIRLSSIYGKIDEPGSNEALQLEVKLESGKIQKLSLYGIPRNLLTWDKGQTEYSKYLFNFGSFFQLSEFTLKTIKLSVQGFHYFNKQQNTRDSIVSVIPLSFTKSLKGKAKKTNTLF